eukprot:4408707-Amphidinium_carterae.1
MHLDVSLRVLASSPQGNKGSLSMTRQTLESNASMAHFLEAATDSKRVKSIMSIHARGTAFEAMYEFASPTARAHALRCYLEWCTLYRDPTLVVVARVCDAQADTVDDVWSYVKPGSTPGLQSLQTVGSLLAERLCLSKAKLLPRRSARLLALLKAASAINAVVDSTAELVNEFSRCLWAHEVRLIDKALYFEFCGMVHSWRTTHDPAWIRAMGSPLGNHPGFNAAKGQTKRTASAFFAEVLNGAMEDQQWALRLCDVYLTGCRARAIPLKKGCVLTEAVGADSLDPRALWSCRAFGFPNMAVVASSKPFVASLTHGLMYSGETVFKTKDDPFAPGAARALVHRLYITGWDTYSKYDELMQCERWDAEQLREAMQWLRTKVAEIEAMGECDGLESDLSLNDQMSRCTLGEIIKEAIISELGPSIDSSLCKIWSRAEQKGYQCLIN